MVYNYMGLEVVTIPKLLESMHLPSSYMERFGNSLDVVGLRLGWSFVVFHCTERANQPGSLAAVSPTSATGFLQGLLFWLHQGGYRKGSFKRDSDIDVEVDVDIDSYFGCFKVVSKSVQVLLNDIQTIMVLTLISLK